MDRTHEPLHLLLDKWSSVHWKIVDTPTTFIWIILFFDGAFLLCVEICNFGQCYIFVSYLYSIVKFDITVVSWYEYGITLKPIFHVMVYLSKLFWILETPTPGRQILEAIFSHLFMYLYLKYMPWAEERRLCVQSLKATCCCCYPLVYAEVVHSIINVDEQGFQCLFNEVLPSNENSKNTI
jgi:hypothetical protein